MRNDKPRTLMQVSVFDNKRYTAAEKHEIYEMIEQVNKNRDKRQRMKIQFIDWKQYPSAADQIRLISRTDVYVSGPGTGITFSTFLRDGAVVLSLGEFREVHGVMMPMHLEEYLTAGSPWHRGLYYDRCDDRHIEANRLEPLITKAVDIARDCKGVGSNHVPMDNLSPAARTFVQVIQTASNKFNIWPKNVLSYSEFCDWAEVLVFASNKSHLCAGTATAFGYSISELDKLRVNNGIGRGCAHEKADRAPL